MAGPGDTFRWANLIMLSAKDGGLDLRGDLRGRAQCPWLRQRSGAHGRYNGYGGRGCYRPRSSSRANKKREFVTQDAAWRSPPPIGPLWPPQLPLRPRAATWSVLLPILARKRKVAEAIRAS